MSRKQYSFNGLAGCVEQWRSRATGMRCGLYHSEQAGMESDPELPWSTVCEEHGTLVSHGSLKAARSCRDPREWCDDCRAITRAQAIADGSLVSLADIPELGALCMEEGFLAPIAMTRTVFEECVAGSKERLWEVLAMLRHAMRTPQPQFLFQMHLTTLKCVVGPGDSGEVVITIMFPEQD